MDEDLVAWRREGFEPGRRAAGQAQCRLAGRQIDDAHVAQGNARAKPCAQRLGASFLGGEALRVRGSPACPRIGFALLRLSEAAPDETLTEARERVLDAPDIAKVVAEADDHL